MQVLILQVYRVLGWNYRNKGMASSSYHLDKIEKSLVLMKNLCGLTSFTNYWTVAFKKDMDLLKHNLSLTNSVPT